MPIQKELVRLLLKGLYLLKFDRRLIFTLLDMLHQNPIFGSILYYALVYFNDKVITFEELAEQINKLKFADYNALIGFGY